MHNQSSEGPQSSTSHSSSYGPQSSTSHSSSSGGACEGGDGVGGGGEGGGGVGGGGEGGGGVGGGGDGEGGDGDVAGDGEVAGDGVGGDGEGSGSGGSGGENGGGGDIAPALPNTTKSAMPPPRTSTPTRIQTQSGTERGAGGSPSAVTMAVSSSLFAMRVSVSSI